MIQRVTEFHFLGLSIKAFALLLALGCAGGLFQVTRSAKRSLVQSRFNAGLATLVTSLLAARAVYAGVNWPYFQTHLAEIPAVWQGGLSWPGALLGGLLGLLLASLWQQQSFMASADDLLPLLFSLSLVSWLGCWLEGCAYGPLSQAWWALPALDEWGQISRRLPLQLAGALISLALYWSSAQLQRQPGKRRPGLVAGLGLAALSLWLLLASLLRADPAPTWHGLRLDAWAAFGFLLLAGMGLGVIGVQKYGKHNSYNVK